MLACCGRPRSASFCDRFPYIGPRYARETIAETCSIWVALATAIMSQPGSHPLWRVGSVQGTLQHRYHREEAIMLIERIWSANPYRNFHYLIACPESGEALAVDPLEWRLCLDAARQKGWTITQILNTHEHLDHTGGNAGLVGATQAKVLAHAGAASRIGGVDRGLGKGDVIRVGRTLELECLDTPGHTMAHICLLGHGDQPALFCGDTLFNSGAGNCHNG